MPRRRFVRRPFARALSRGRRGDLLAALFFLAAGLAEPFVRMALFPGPQFSGRVVRIVDGDTLHLAGVPAPVRLWGVDAPERDEAGFDAATRALRAIAAGERLDCRRMDVDRYGRAVARCLRADGQDVSALMIAGGTAGEYVRYSRGYYTARALAGR